MGSWDLRLGSCHSTAAAGASDTIFRDHPRLFAWNLALNIPSASRRDGTQVDWSAGCIQPPECSILLHKCNTNGTSNSTRGAGLIFHTLIVYLVSWRYNAPSLKVLLRRVLATLRYSGILVSVNCVLSSATGYPLLSPLSSRIASTSLFRP